MQIKRLRLSGFKSFVEPADLRIEPGLTGIVGPNGCGKSNVLEAIRWVMGESSAKSMRGSGMEDVIFAGTATRPSRDFAEVTLSIERDPSDIADPEGVRLLASGDVEVTRRIERGAGSAYRINGRDVRARDVGLLFADAATGAHSPALVSQGRISAIIAAKPAERRLMLEEAAGIAGLHVRRRDAEQKLRAAEANLTRLDELLGDMEQRAAALKRQARAAERYRKLSDEIRVAEARLVFSRWKEAADAAAAARKDAELAVAAVDAAAKAHAEAADAQRAAAEAVAASRNAATAARERASDLGHELARLRAERDSARRRLDELTRRRDTLVADRAREAALRDDAAAALDRLQEEIDVLDARLADAGTQSEKIAERLAEAEGVAREADAALASARSAEAAEQAEHRLARAQLDGAAQRLARAEAEAQRIADQLAQLNDGEDLVSRRRAAREAREAAEARLEQAGEAIGAAEAQREAAAAERDSAQADAAAARAALAALESEATALRKAVEGSAGDRAINQVRAAKGFERALAAALGEDLEAAIGDGGPRGWTGASPKPGDPALPVGAAPLADHVKAPAALARRLAQIGVVDSDDGSLELAVGQRLVTKEGRLRRWDGFVATGLGAAAAERLIRVNRLEEIEAALPAARDAVTSAQARIDTALAAVQAAREAADTARRAEVEANGAIRDAVREEDQVNTELERLEIRRSGLDERADQAAKDVAEAQARHAEAQAALDALPDPAATRQRVQVAAEAAETAQAAVAEARAEFATHARALAADQQRRTAAAQEIEAWGQRSSKAAERDEELARRIHDADEEAASLADAPERLGAQADAAETASAEAARAATEAAAGERAAETALQATEGRLANANEALAIAREARAGALARAESQDHRRVEMGRISGEKFECPPPLLPQRMGFEEPDLGEAHQESARLEKLTQDRERIGPVNLIAERELAELEEEVTTSAAEREELGTAIHRLRGSIGSLNREGRARLLTAFEAVDRHFRSLFTTLFEGGQAHLELVESDDPLEAGLEIMAQPPGKRLQSLTLLSGGEQALTAVALIFALFLTNPAPICVLDEVDAPLDDANIERFCSLLDRMTQETDTRYLIVTHNAVTMSRMHRLFGVTMVEKGVSRLVSVDLGGAERLLAAE
ncbi:MAG: chromosome segregation SMC family protein [Allosphingosinicella sp.]|uniref:chromosome segregation SMC family protein n=1 Tax=Allosphingosinicella sp. TaxID=2823234 RepID=UPI0039596501